MADRRRKILITGASGGLAGILTGRLIKKYQLIGVDPRPIPHGRNFPGEFIQVEYTHRKMAEVFRQHKFYAMIHLGRIRLGTVSSGEDRFRNNVLGTHNLLMLGRKYGIKHLIVFSTFHVYGAHNHNHLHMSEETPLRASQTFPELMDAIELDHAATTFMWKYRDVRTVILRPVNVVGGKIRNTVTQLLRGEYCPYVLGFDPLLQFIHEKDIARALDLCLQGKNSGIYNVSGEGSVPYSKAIAIAGAKAVPVPAMLAYSIVGTLAKFNLAFPKHLIDYFRYPTIISDEAFRREYKYQPEVSTVEAIKSIHRGISQII